MQQHFDLIPHPVQGGIIYQRPKDGYINATAKWTTGRGGERMQLCFSERAVECNHKRSIGK